MFMNIKIKRDINMFLSISTKSSCYDSEKSHVADYKDEGESTDVFDDPVEMKAPPTGTEQS